MSGETAAHVVDILVEYHFLPSIFDTCYDLYSHKPHLDRNC